MTSNLKYCVWYIINICIVILTMTILATIQGAPMWGWTVAIGLLILQIVGLTYYLHRGPEKKESKVLKLILKILFISFIGVLGWLTLAVYSLGSQYHNPVLPESLNAGDHNARITETEELYVIYPSYSNIEFTTSRQYKSDESITFCSGATFQQSYDLLFKPEEIAVGYVENGKYYSGYEVEGMGAFTFYNGMFHFTKSENAKEALMTAAKKGGAGFCQFMIIDDGKIVLEPADEYRCFRVLAQLEGKLCIIDAKKQIHFHDFAKALVKLGVTHAMYMDMGSGWNYSWYRNNDGEAKTLIGIPWPFSHNWIVFRK